MLHHCITWLNTALATGTKRYTETQNLIGKTWKEVKRPLQSDHVLRLSLSVHSPSAEITWSTSQAYLMCKNTIYINTIQINIGFGWIWCTGYLSKKRFVPDLFHNCNCRKWKRCNSMRHRFLSWLFWSWLSYTSLNMNIFITFSEPFTFRFCLYCPFLSFSCLYSSFLYFFHFLSVFWWSLFSSSSVYFSDLLCTWYLSFLVFLCFSLLLWTYFHVLLILTILLFTALSFLVISISFLYLYCFQHCSFHFSLC